MTGPRAWWLAGGLAAALWVQLALTLPSPRAVQLNDFPGYYGAAQVMLAGEPERLYDAQRKWFTNLPVVAWALAPLARLDYAAAWKLFWWLQVLCYGATFGAVLLHGARFLRPFTPLDVVWAAAVFAAFGPVLRRCLVLGQTTPLVVLALAVTALAARAGWPRGAGAVLGLACLVKIPPLLLAGGLLVRRRLALAGTALGVVALGVALSLGVFGSELVGQFADRVIWDNFGRAQAAFNNRSLDGAFMRALTHMGLVDYDPIPRPLAVRLAVLGSTAALLGGLAWRGGWALLWPARPPDDGDPRRGSLELELALGVALMCLLFPVVWIHYYLFLVVPLAWLPAWARARGVSLRPWAVALFLLGAWLASGSEVLGNHHYGGVERGWLFRQAQSLQTLGALLLCAALAHPLAVLAGRARALTTPGRG